MRFATALLLTSSVLWAGPARAPENPRRNPTTKEQVWATFEHVAREALEDLLEEKPEVKRKEIARQLGIDAATVPAFLAGQLMQARSGAFAMSEREALAILAEEFDDEANRAKANQALAVLDDLNIRLPELNLYLRKIVKRKNGIELEFAARLLNDQLKTIVEALKKTSY